MRKGRLLTLVGSMCLVLVLATLSIMTACAPAVQPEAGEEIAKLEKEVAAEKAKVAELEKEVTRLKAPAEVYEWRLQHAWSAAENHLVQQYADIVKEMSDGRIDITIFSDGELVTKEELPDAVGMGTIDMANVHPSELAGVIPVGLLEQCPFLWGDLDQVMAVIYEYGVGDIYAEAVEEMYDVHVIGIQMDDLGAIIIRDEFSCLADLEGRVLNIADPLASTFSKLAGTSSTYLPCEEIYTALAMGTIDGAEWGGVKCMYDMGFHEVAKYLMMPYGWVAWTPFYHMNRELWEELPAHLQTILIEGVNGNTMYMRSYYAGAETEAMAAMGEAGVTVVTLPVSDVKALTRESLAWLDEYAAMSPRCETVANICLEALKAFGRID